MQNKAEINRKRWIIERFRFYLSPFELDLQEKSKMILAGSIIIITSPVLISFSMLHILGHDLFLGYILLIAGLSLIFSLLILKKLENIAVFSRTNLVIVGILFLYLLARSTPDGHMALWLYVYPLVVFFLLGHIEGLFFNLAFFVFILFFFLIQDFTPFTPIYPIEFKIRFSIALFLVGGLSYTYEFIRYKFHKGMVKNQRQLTKETERLANSKKEAEEANRAKSEFLANMSHELRTPLNHIIGFTEVLLNKNDSKLDSVQTEYITDIHSSGKHLLALINDVLDLAEIESGKRALNISAVNLKEVMENSLAFVNDITLKNRIALSWDVDGVPQIIQSDERKLKQIMSNLLANAAKFTPIGGSVIVSAKLVDCRIRSARRNDDPKFLKIILNPKDDSVVSGDHTKKCVEISVTDSGIGIRKEDQKRVFNRFEQINGSTNKKFQGTGVGLALTKRLVELMGGKIWVESDGEGKGSTFRFIIPT
jgi:signal transduction histidine kinase